MKSRLRTFNNPQLNIPFAAEQVNFFVRIRSYTPEKDLC